MTLQPPGEVLDQLNAEHAAVAEQIERFAAQLFDPERRAAAADSLRELLIDIGMHFGFEESLMEGDAYADLEHHRRQHLGIMTELGLLLDRVAAGGDPAGTARSADLLGQWYREHVETSDQALLAWLSAAA
ncbi:MAG: hemerythrin family protein [Pseudomonadota bacterium]